MPQGRVHVTVHLVSKGLVCTEEVVLETFINKNGPNLEWHTEESILANIHTYTQAFCQKKLISISILFMRCDFTLMLAITTVRLRLSKDWIKPYEESKLSLKFLLKIISKNLSLQNRTTYLSSFILSPPTHLVNEKVFPELMWWYHNTPARKLQ